MAVMLATALVITAIAGMIPAVAAGGDVLPVLQLRGRTMCTSDGQAVVLKGCNLGNWLLIEPWMLGIHDGSVVDQYDMITTLEGRFGADKTEQLMDSYRENWVGRREFAIAKSFGFNLLRVPFDHHLLADDERPFELRDDAFEWLDRAVALAKETGVYLILDMHGVPGGQSTDMTSGRVGENELWESETHQRRTAWLWQRIAERYREDTAVVAYDIMNEPWGDYREDMRQGLVAIVGAIHDAIRKVDQTTVIFAAGTPGRISFYGDPAKRGWTNVGLTEHFYPGLFNQGMPSLETHAAFLATTVPSRADLVKKLNVPYLVGEFNVVFDSAAQPEIMRRYYDTFAANGWWATMWSLRTINPAGGVHANNWFLATNAEPFVFPDMRTASYEDLGRAVRRLGDIPLDVDEELRKELKTDRPRGIALAADDVYPQAPERSRLAGELKGANIGEAPPGGESGGPDGGVVVWGGGMDVWGAHDDLRFVNKPAKGEFSETVWLMGFNAVHPHAKAGLMLRESLSPDAAHVFVHAFNDGRVMLGWRAKQGQTTRERHLQTVGFPVGLGFDRRADGLHVRYTNAEGRWQEERVGTPVELKEGLIGLAVNSHDELVVARAEFSRHDPRASLEGGDKEVNGNLLRNGSFEIASEKGEDQAKHWSRWGEWFNRDQDWEPQRDGRCLLGYHHWQVGTESDSGVYQDVTGLRPGERVRFTVFANRDIPSSSHSGPKFVELRLESPSPSRNLMVASRRYECGSVASGGSWSRLQVDGTAPGERMRVLIVVEPGRERNRDAALKFDQASLVRLTD